MRAYRPGGQGTLFEEAGYDYYFWVTNMGQHEFADVELIKFYRKRGHAENFIKEQKYGFDLKHYPCQSLAANKIYGLIAAFAYTLMRYMSLAKPKLKKTKHGIVEIHQYAKANRKKWLLLPTQVVCHAGEVIFRYSRQHFKEVRFWLEHIQNLEFGTS